MKNSYWVGLLAVCAASFVLGVANASPLVSEKKVKQFWEERFEKTLGVFRSETYFYHSQEGH